MVALYNDCMPSNQIRMYYIVACGDCFGRWEKRSDSLEDWGGRCLSCTRKDIQNRPEVKNSQRERSRRQVLQQGGIPNAHKFTSDNVGGEKHTQWKGGFPKCANCGETTHSYSANYCAKCKNIPLRGNPRSPEVVEKMRQNARKGEDCHFWIDGRSTSNYQQWRRSHACRRWRKAVLFRDNYACQDCGKRLADYPNLRLQAHHLKAASEFPELRDDISNGLTLCFECHKKTESWGYAQHQRLKNMAPNLDQASG